MLQFNSCHYASQFIYCRFYCTIDAFVINSTSGLLEQDHMAIVYIKRARVSRMLSCDVSRVVLFLNKHILT